MKNIFYISLYMLLLTSLACSSKSSVPQNGAELTPPQVKDLIDNDLLKSDKVPTTENGAPTLQDEKTDCHGKRAIGQTYEEVEASILKIGDQYVISLDNGNTRLKACELPKKVQEDGLLVRVSGEALEIFPGERLIATPFRLRNIKEREQ